MDNFHKKNEGGLYQVKVNLSLTFFRRIGCQAHNRKMFIVQNSWISSQGENPKQITYMYL